MNIHLPGRPGLRPLPVLVSLACLAMHAAPRAQTGPQVHATLPAVVVSGSSQNNLLADDLPLSADVIEGQNLSDQQIHTLRQALQDLPNTAVRTSPTRLAVSAGSAAFARDGNMGINIRGLGGNRVLMTVDGIRMPRSYVSRSAMFDREYLSLELFKRVDVIRGPASAQYGGDGMAGVVNFVTHDPMDFLRTGEGEAPKTLGGRVAAGWSEDDHGYFAAGTIAAKASDSLQWMLTATGRQSHALDTMGSNDEPNSNRTRPDPADYRDRAILGKVVLRPSSTQRHIFTFEHTQKKSDTVLLSSLATGVSPRPSDALAEDANTRIERDRLTWDARFGINTDWADHLRTVVAVQDASSRRIGNSHLRSGVHRVRDNRYDERTWQLGLQADKVLRHGDWSHRIVYGLEHARSKITNLYDGKEPLPPESFPLKRFPDTRQTSSGLYVQDETVHGDWTITPGLRIDHFAIDVTSQDLYYPPAPQPGKSLSGTAALPKLGVLYRATPAWSVFGQYATGYRAPDAGQVNDRFEAVALGVTNIIIANPDLQPERSRGVELGVRGRFDRLSLDMVGFANRYSNLIEDARLINKTATRQTFQAVNIARARIHGFELKGGYDWGSIGPGRLHNTFAYGQSRGTDKTTNAPLNSISPMQMALGLRYDTAPWSVYADLRHYAAKKDKDIDLVSIGNNKAGTTQFATPSATTLDLGAQWRITKAVRVNVVLNNVTNRKYWMWPDVYSQPAGSATIDAYSQPGRNARLSLVADF